MEMIESLVTGLQDRGTETRKTGNRVGLTETEGTRLAADDAAAAVLARGAREVTKDLRRENERKGRFD